MINLLQANIAGLQKAELLLLNISDEQFQAQVSAFSGSVGKHMRHVTDHYQIFLNNEAQGLFDYDHRPRETQEERQRSAMILKIRHIRTKFQALLNSDTEDRPVKIKLSVDDGPNTPEIPSMLSRELVFLQSHSVHHYAIISGILKLQQVAVDADFGIAASTLQFEQHHQCAP